MKIESGLGTIQPGGGLRSFVLQTRNFPILPTWGLFCGTHRNTQSGVPEMIGSVVNVAIELQREKR